MPGSCDPSHREPREASSFATRLLASFRLTNAKVVIAEYERAEILERTRRGRMVVVEMSRNLLEIPCMRLLDRALTSVLLLVFSGCMSTAEPEWISTKSAIVGGEVFSDSPAIGVLYNYNGQDGICTGTLIGPKTVLTVAHCVYGYDPTKVTFLIGPTMAHPTQSVGVKSSRAHPDFVLRSLENDIALVTLTREPTGVKPLGRIDRIDQSWKGRSVLFVGYGRDVPTELSSRGTKHAAWMRLSEVADSEFYYRDPEGRNICYGDSGGPALWKNENDDYLIVGIHSTGGDGCEGWGMDTRVDVYSAFFN